MEKEIQCRLQALRHFLRKEGLQACIIPSSDPHLSEYVAPHWQAREWLSGFTGSAGTVVVTLEKAGLWTDSRYFLQAAEQLAGSGIDLYKEMLPETPSIPAFLCSGLSAGSKVALDGNLISVTTAEGLSQQLTKQDLHLITDIDPVASIWTDRPAIPDHPAYLYDEAYAGKSAADKLADIRRALAGMGSEALLISALDEVAWTLNLRGDDVAYNPVVISHLLVTRDGAVLFIDPKKVTDAVRQNMDLQGVTLKPYEALKTYLSEQPLPVLSLNPAQISYSVYASISAETRILRDKSPVSFLKAVRNEQEIKGLKDAMKKDGVALVKFLMWLEKSLPKKKETELSVAQKLHEFRAEQPLYKGESFETIAGYGAHAAIVHYSATPETNVVLQPHGFLLLDSGAQYLDGTTDITRTIALGELTQEECMDYTLVLKGHIALASAVFPAGTRGTQLDVLARMPMWKQKYNFLHGTGHGVGHFLHVHEGPQSIRMNENPVSLLPGMLTSNEPGIYKAGSHGVRTENLMLTVRVGEGMFGDYYRFETMTLCPICTKGIIWEMLTEEETAWLNAYHRHVYDSLAERLNEEEKKWLYARTYLHL